MKKPSALRNTGIKTTLFVSLVLLATWTFAQRADTGLARATSTAAKQAEALSEKALEANYQFLYAYNVHTTHGFRDLADTVSPIPNSIALNEKALEANNQFLYDYNVNTTHGFSNSTTSATVPSRPYLHALDVTEDEAGCLAAQAQLSLRDCLTAVYHARFVNAYTLGQLR